MTIDELVYSHTYEAITHVRARQEVKRNLRALRDVFMLDEEEMVQLVKEVFSGKETT